MLAKYKDISQRLARAEGLTEAQARALAKEGKAVVWIDGGLHATEVLGASQLAETIYQLVSRTDEETMRFLNDLIILAVHANPDGMELVSNWYMKEQDEKKRSSNDIPRLYQKYVGHDNNRDFYALNQPESRNMTKQLSIEWIPQIMYNHHQTGPTGAVLFAPPFRDPFNYNLDPLIVTGLDLVGASMHNRFVVENKPGATMRRGANYSTWWNGGLRTAVYFHNQIGLLTETIGNPTPVEIEFVPQRVLPTGDTPAAHHPAEVALPPVHRLFGHRELRGPRRRLASPRAVPLQHLQDGTKLDRTRQQRQLDHVAEGDRRGSRGGRQGDAGALRPRLHHQPHHGSGGAVRRERRRPVTGGAGEVLRRAAQARRSRSARLHHPLEPGGLSDRGEVHQRPATFGHHRPSRHRRLHGSGEELPEGVAGGEDRAGLPSRT